jgi:flavin reductase (DIM6/NTAB) family NADH-FMN oxidoreductase RutF/DNA-binding IclR family transcriptional regulator
MSASEGITPEGFRKVLGQFPTGVAVVTAVGADGQPVGMAVGSFTSVSLDPPLVGFLPARTSRTWPEIEQAGRFCVNILSDEQEALCRRFARSGEDKFAGVPWRLSPQGSPVLEGALAWIDCGLARVDEAGDHLIVLGEVRSMDSYGGPGPLVFFRGGYGQFRSGALVAGDPQGDLVVPLRIVDRARNEIEELAKRSKTHCAVTALVGDQAVVLASAGGNSHHASNTFIGGRVRATPPIGSSFMAWEPPDRVAAWMGPSLPTVIEQTIMTRLAATKRRGFAVSIAGGGIEDWEKLMSEANGSPPASDRLLTLTRSFNAEFERVEPEQVRNIHVPVLGPDGRVGVVLNVGGFPPLDRAGLAHLIEEVRAVARQMEEITGSEQRPGAPTVGASVAG